LAAVFIILAFFVLIGSYDKIYFDNRQGLVTICIVDQNFYSHCLFAALARAAAKMRTSVIAQTETGCGF
jgi:hypothetical protein